MKHFNSNRHSGMTPTNCGEVFCLPDCRRGVSRIEVFVVALVCIIFLTVTVPMLLNVRSIARTAECKTHLKKLSQGLNNYHDSFGMYPPAAVWSTTATRSIALHSTSRIDLVTHQNWSQLILPFIGEDKLAQSFVADRPIGDPVNADARLTRLPVMVCADDTYNNRDNHYEFCVEGLSGPGVSFARGNYAINGGTQSLPLEGPSTTACQGDYTRLVMRESPREYQLWGNGIAGINRSFSSDTFKNGLSHLVALDEVRAGIHPTDPRGVWALGQIGGSITWAHGVGSDAYGPNNRWPRADDILGCQNLHTLLGEDTLTEAGMPCVSYVDSNRQATARSQHPGGAHVGFLDGSVRFITNNIDPGLWHVIHSRSTPDEVLNAQFEQLLQTTEFEGELQRQFPIDPDAEDEIPALFATGAFGTSARRNSLGMTFSLIPAGVFEMGVPDHGNDRGAADGFPAHTIQITRSFLLSSHEVTQSMYMQVMGSPPAAVSELPGAAEYQEDYPVVNVTWFEAAEFCRRLSSLPAEQAAGRRYRLPTEAEWEYACRDATSVPYQWSRVQHDDDRTGEAAGVSPSLPLTVVGSYPPNTLGLYDMRGNAWEWTADWFDRDYYSRSPQQDPQGPAGGFIKVVRGGDWRYIGEICRIDYPMMPPWTENPLVGFRVICEIEYPGQTGESEN